MDDYNIIKTHNYIDQGTTVYNTLIKDFLRANYFKSEPRTTLYWVTLIKEISCKGNMHPYGKYWYDLLPEKVSAQLIAEYIEDPRGTIAANRFNNDEIRELRQPQRILLFYFLKKLGQYKDENPRIIRNFNQMISKDIFLLNPRPAVPDKGFLTVENVDSDLMDISPGLLLNCIVADEQITRKYETTSYITGHQLNLNQAYLAAPSLMRNRLCVTNQVLPLTDTIYPFRLDVLCPIKYDDRIFFPSIIITSTLLCMSEGVRHIQLTMDIENTTFLERDKFKFKITTAEGWREITEDEVELDCCVNQDGCFIFEFKFNAKYPPITPMMEIQDEEIYLTLKSAIMMEYTGSEEARFSVKQVDLKVCVHGLRPVAIRNQEMVLNLQDDYQPFGVDAELQSAFSFTHAELMHPELEEIDLMPEWVAVPEDLDIYYEAYKKRKDDFKVDISTIYRAEGALGYTTCFNDQNELFDPVITFRPHTIKATSNVCTSINEEETDPMNFNLYYQLQLVGQDFGQSEYPLLMTKYAIGYAKYENAWIQRPKNKPVDVNMPYIPLWSDLLINYSSKTVTWTPSSKNEIIYVYKNEPKGYKRYYGEKIDLGEDEHGVFYLGFKDLVKEGIGTLYFNGETGNPRAPAVTHTWWYLVENKWEKLTDHILEDGTNGLTQAGIISWTIPTNMSDISTIMPKSIFWIKMTIEPIPDIGNPPRSCGRKELKYYDYLMSLTGVFANACSIRRQRKELEESNNVSPLEAGSTLVLQDSDLNYEFNLPYNTFGQVDKESNLDFWARAFNRVRNRGRMVCEQDYEDLLLQNFRNLSVVKTIPRWEGRNYIDIVVINRQVYDTVPYAMPELNSVKELKEIREGVFPFSTPFLGNAVELNVVNPCYQEIGFLVYLKFKGNATLAEKELQLYEDLVAFVNPWRVLEDQPLQFGCWFDYAEITSFLQGRSYIAAVFDIKMGFPNGERLTFPEEYEFSEEEILILTEPNMIVVVEHPDDNNWLGIGTMVVGENFVVSDSSEEDMDEPKIQNYE